MEKLADISFFESLGSCSSEQAVFNGAIADYIVKRIAPNKKKDQKWADYLKRHQNNPATDWENVSVHHEVQNH